MRTYSTRGNSTSRRGKLGSKNEKYWVTLHLQSANKTEEDAGYRVPRPSP